MCHGRPLGREYLHDTMPATQAQTRIYSIADYLTLERDTNEKWEFFDGELFIWEAMAGSSPPHAKICSELSALINLRLDRHRCNSFNSDLKLSIHALRRYRYPDLTVVCGPLEYDTDIPQAVRNPSILVEVTSPSSKDADYTSKAKQYMEHVPALRDYLIVEQDKCFATLFSRAEADAAWTVRQFADPETEITIASIGVSFTLAEVYRNIAWENGKAVVRLPGESPNQVNRRIASRKPAGETQLYTIRSQPASSWPKPPGAVSKTPVSSYSFRQNASSLSPVAASGLSRAQTKRLPRAGR